jgi:hypothetical protein
MAIGDRLKRLEGGRPDFCAACPYREGPQVPQYRTATRYVDADGNGVGYESDLCDPGEPELCESCPGHDASFAEGRQPILFITVTRTVRAGA